MRVQVRMPGKSIVVLLNGIEEFERLSHALDTANLDPECLGRLPSRHPDIITLTALGAKLHAARPDFLPPHRRPPWDDVPADSSPEQGSE